MVPDFLQEDREVYVPDFAREEDREYPAAENVNQGAMRGTAVHRVMECLDFAAIADIDTSDAGAVSAFVKQELDRMLANGQLPGEWYALVIPEMIEAFVESPIAPRMAAAAVRGDLYRERPFVMQHQMEASGGTVLVQGIIDVFWMENDKIILLVLARQSWQEERHNVFHFCQRVTNYLIMKRSSIRQLSHCIMANILWMRIY